MLCAMFPKMVDLWANIKAKTNVQESQQSKFVALHKIKVLQRKKVLKHIMESLHLNTMVACYKKHFASYNMGKKYVIQLIHVAVWKQFT